MKNVFVQCELWCDEILRRVARPCCTCSRHVSAQALDDLAPSQRLRISPGSSRAFAPGVEISLTQCPVCQTQSTKQGECCPASKSTTRCGQTTTSYLMYSTKCSKGSNLIPTRLSSKASPESFATQATSSRISKSRSFATVGSLLLDLHKGNYEICQRLDNFADTDEGSESSISAYCTPPNSNSVKSNESTLPHWQAHPTTMYAEVYSNRPIEEKGRSTLSDCLPRRLSHTQCGYSSRKLLPV